MKAFQRLFLQFGISCSLEMQNPSPQSQSDLEDLGWALYVMEMVDIERNSVLNPSFRRAGAMSTSCPTLSPAPSKAPDVLWVHLQ